MGERNWKLRYQTNREYADEQAQAFERGEKIRHWRYVTDWLSGMPEPMKETLIGAQWVAWSYQIATESAETLVRLKGPSYQSLVTENKRLVSEYQEKAMQEPIER